MATSLNQINTLLRSLDIEDLIATGAPKDEYDVEARDIANALAAMPLEQMTEDKIISVVSEIWKKSFDLNSDDIAARMQQFIMFSEKINNNKIS